MLSDAVPYFEAAAGVPLPQLTNPADWLIDLIDADAVSVTANTPVSTTGGDAVSAPAPAPAPADAPSMCTPKPARRGLLDMLAREPPTRTVRRWRTPSNPSLGSSSSPNPTPNQVAHFLAVAVSRAALTQH